MFTMIAQRNNFMQGEDDKTTKGCVKFLTLSLSYRHIAPLEQRGVFRDKAFFTPDED